MARNGRNRPHAPISRPGSRGFGDVIEGVVDKVVEGVVDKKFKAFTRSSRRAQTIQSVLLAIGCGILIALVAGAAYVAHEGISVPAVRAHVAEQLAQSQSETMRRVADQISPVERRVAALETTVKAHDDRIGDNTQRINELAAALQKAGGPQISPPAPEPAYEPEPVARRFVQIKPQKPSIVPSIWDTYANSDACKMVIKRSRTIAQRTPEGHIALRCKDQSGYNDGTWAQACLPIDFLNGKTIYGNCIKIFHGPDPDTT